ncbi:hypothetical protein QF044_002323 [Chryseobacterium sp. W4I1]|nr:hypothetical protein [Chryseobacterium sp. W4I1]
MKNYFLWRGIINHYMSVSKFISLLLVFKLFNCGVIYAQEFSIKGQIVDNSKQPIAFSTVRLQNVDKSLIINGLTDSLGIFSTKK